LFDLLFVANLGWLLLLLPGFATGTDTAIDFWQVYFLTLPHRWLTLVLVLTDEDRRAGQRSLLLLLGVALAVGVVGVQFGTGALLCLAMVDYVWNAWHFASQHAGVLRIYSRKVGGGVEWLERWGLRFFITYAALRAAGWSTGWLEVEESYRSVLLLVDSLCLALPVCLLLSNLVSFAPQRVGKLIYLSSVCSLYTGFLLSLQFGWSRLVVIFAAAGSMFHAVEYLAVVTHYAWRRRNVGGANLFRTLAHSWLIFLATYVLLLGWLGVWASDPANPWFLAWQGLNLWAAFVHYAFDGIIWKLRRPDTAAVLGATHS
jgi:hypothetical protein